MEHPLSDIDRINILQASLLAMQRACAQLHIKPDHILVDGNQCPRVDAPCQAIIQGDSLIPVISAASILAKVVRDDEMIALDDHYPGYGFAGHKGYPTKAHIAAIQQLGVTEIHRRSFAPVRRALEL